ncbi:M48 family metallopeptidase [Thiocystis violacea]|uniref:M48 family metallopeptidase n=1 Tax=Thiocystis violacea TaxID=13725 RepID=UPI0019072DC3|nr:SprT family zinc-dependent metalloprotease [Thiocystis violacea]MBK1720473.1 metal-dependent hydrolase [Thiocystis violacea]
MTEQFHLGDIAVDVVFKDIKNIHLSVYPPDGRVRLAAPARLSLETLRVFALSKLGWIKQQQRKLREQARETPRELLDRESHDLWGRRYLLQVIEHAAPPTLVLQHHTLVLQVRPGTSAVQRQEILAGWYRQQLRDAAATLIAVWETRLGVRVERIFVQRMKTRWGSCNPEARTIRLNTELAKKPLPCLEYVVAHELTHLLARRHDARFRSLLDAHLPQWPHYRALLNRLPLAHEAWGLVACQGVVGHEDALDLDDPA